MAKKTAQPNPAGFTEIQNKAIQPEQSKAPKKKADKKVEEVAVVVEEPAVQEPAAQEPIAEEPVVASEPASEPTEQFTRGFLVSNRRGFNPDARVKDADFAFRVLGDSVFTKGFLGRSLRENSGLPSVGVSSARRAGVMVDENGKMRCPPGTPNANQFTDINMSNCMIPSAETVAQQAADAAKEASKKAADGFKRGTSTKAVKPNGVAPIAHVGFADADGFAVQKRVNVGNTVISPVDGSERSLMEFEDSVAHIAEGGKLTDIPDEHLLDAIFANAAKRNIEDEQAIAETLANTGKILVIPKKRFTIIGEGGGMNGMTRFEDGATGALIGIKYPNGNGGRYQDEALNEVLSEIVGTHFGYEPMPMRLTFSKRVKDQYSEEDRYLNLSQALVSELAHNRYAGDIESGGFPASGEDPTDISTDQLARMALFDSVLANPDRHEQNMLFAIGEDGKEATLIPIDQSLGFTPGAPTSEEQMNWWIKSAGGVAAVRLDLQAEKKNTEEDRKRMISEISQIQEELRNIDIDKLNIQFDEAFKHYSAYLMGNPNAERRKSIQDVVKRLEIIRDADPEMLMKLIMERYPDPAKPVVNGGFDW